MVRWLKRGLSVLGAVAALWALPAAAEGTPVDCGTVDCEGIREMKALYSSEIAYFQEKDRYSAVLADVGFAPAPCADGGYPPEVKPGWVMGCHFAYRVTSVTGLPFPTFTAEARGRTGTPAEGVRLEISGFYPQVRVFWLERAGQRRFVGWDECLPAQSFTCDAQAREGLTDIRNLYIAERSYFAEKDTYSSNLAHVGFMPESCSDGTQPPVPQDGSVAGCRFVYRVTVTGPRSFIATAQGVSGAVEGMVLTMDETGKFTLTRPFYGRCDSGEDAPLPY